MEKQFAEQLAGQLQGCVEKKEFDRLVIVAPPAMLGDLRKYLTNEVAVKIVAEVDKDLAKIPNDEISSHLANVVTL
jgi:protein required for attachment to host cells